MRECDKIPGDNGDFRPVMGPLDNAPLIFVVNAGAMTVADNLINGYSTIGISKNRSSSSFSLKNRVSTVGLYRETVI